MARKTWVLDTDTKGTGANVVPLEKALADEGSAPPRRRKARPLRKTRKARPAERADGATWSTRLPEGHVRKKATGEIGRIQAVDPRAGTVTVRWLKSGSVSTVPLSSVSRR